MTISMLLATPILASGALRPKEPQEIVSTRVLLALGGGGQ